MYCLKCGRETTEQHVFCDGCLQGMACYPVKPDTPIQLPQRGAAQPPKKNARTKRPVSAEEQLALLKRRNRRLVWGVIALSLVALLSLLWLLRPDQPLPQESRMGRNYTINTAGTPEG